MSYEFNGTSQYLSATSGIVSGDPATIWARFYPTSESTDRYIVGNGSSTNNNPLRGIPHFNTLTPRSIAAQHRYDTGSVANAVSTGAPTTNAWNTAAGVFTSASSRTVYLNYTDTSTNTNSFTGAITFDRFSIGGLLRSTVVQYFAGRICEVAMWSAALTNAEVASLNAGFKPRRIRPQSLAFYAPLIRTVQDLRNALTITNNNTATVADHPRVY